MAQVAAGNGSHVIDIDVVDDRTQRTDQPPLPDQSAAAAILYHVIDVKVDTTAAPPPELHECAVCMERLRWVAVGPCGHREVCSKCTVRIRSVDGNRLCCICRTPCPAVLVTRRSRTGGDGKLVYNDKVSSLELAANEGRVGKGNYWYHEASAAYFDDERQYNEAQRACSELQRAEVGDEEDEDDEDEGSLVELFIVYVAICFAGGVMFSSGYAAGGHHWGLNLAVLLGSGFGFAAMACIFWFLLDRLHRDSGRH